MPTERQVLETLVRSMSRMGFDVNTAKKRNAKALMAGDIKAVTRLVLAWGSNASAAANSLLRPIQGEIITRSGSMQGRKLTKEFAEVCMKLIGAGQVITPAPS